MPGHLYFICPTDHLEPVINDVFDQENFFITSLGNSIVFNEDMISEVNELLDLKGIRNIFFVLSDNNRIVLEALEKEYSEKSGLSELSFKIKRQRKCAEELWNKNNHQIVTLSYHLNDKIRELRQELNSIRMDTTPINGLIYDTCEKTFKSIYSNLIQENHVSVN